MLWWFAWPWRARLGYDKYFKGCSLKPKSGYCPPPQIPHSKTNGRAPSFSSCACNIAHMHGRPLYKVLIWLRTRGWKPRLCGKPQLQRKPRLSWTTLVKHYSEMHFPEWRTLGWGFKVTPVHSDPQIIAFSCDLWSFIIVCCTQYGFNFQ